MRPWTRLAALPVVIVLLSPPAQAEKIRRGVPADAPKLDLQPVYFQGKRVEIDSFFNDWADAKPVETSTLTAGEHEYDWTGPPDLSAEVAVQYNDESLFVRARVRDNALTLPEKRWGGDTVDIWLDVGGLAKDRYRKLVVDPSYLLANEPPDALWDEPRSMEGRAVPPVRVAGARDDGGYEVEVEIPFDTFSPVPPVFAPMGFCVIVRDWDHDDKNEEEAAVSTCPFDPKKRRPEDLGRINWTTRERVWSGVLTAYPDLQGAPVVSAIGNLGGDARDDEAVLAGKTLFVVGLGLGPGEWYAYDLNLGPEDKAVGLELVDVDGKGDMEMVVTLRRLFHAGDVDVEQDIAVLYAFEDGAITDPLFAAEVANRLVGGEGLVTNKVKYQKGKITIGVDEVRGWDKTTYPDVDGGFHDDYEAILVPWAKPSSRTLKAGSDGHFR